MSFKRYVHQCSKGFLLGAAMVLGVSLCRVEAQLVITEVGDFSDNLGSPTQISPALELGTNVIQGSVDGNTWITEHDYFRITLPSDGRVAGLTLKITNYTAPIGSIGFFDVLPEEEGNSGGTVFSGNTLEVVPFIVGNPGNIVLHMEAPFAGIGEESFCNYEVQVLVAPIETVAGTAIYKAVEITFPSEAGKYYQLQAKSDLDSDVWSNVGTPMLGVGGIQSTFDSTRDANQRFYRVIKQ